MSSVRGRTFDRTDEIPAKSPRSVSVSRPMITVDDVMEAFHAMNVRNDGNVTREAFLSVLEGRPDIKSLLGLDEASFAEVR